MFLTEIGKLKLVIIEHDTIADGELPTGQGISKLQVDIIIESVPTPVAILMVSHEEITLYTQHHR